MWRLDDPGFAGFCILILVALFLGAFAFALTTAPAQGGGCSSHEKRTLPIIGRSVDA